jgi:hypothetical protein
MRKEAEVNRSTEPVRRILGVTVALYLCFGAFLIAQGRPKCPAFLASLMPRNAVHVTGQYNAAGFMSLGFAAADIPFAHPCIQSTAYPGRLSFDIKHYSGEGLALFQMQIDAEEAQRVANRKEELDKQHDKMRASAKESDLVGPVRTETVPGGTLLYFERFIDCSLGVKRVKPYLKLLGVGHSNGTAINIEIEGFIGSGAGKAAAMEVLANFAKADFGRLDARQ